MFILLGTSLKYKYRPSVVACATPARDRMKSRRAMRARLLVSWLACGFVASAATAEIRVVDDAGTTVVLDRPARRIVSLAPNTTELLYAAGAGDRIVGAVEYSDYPEAARSIPRVGGGTGFDLEAIVTLRPDLIVSWQSGNPAWQVARLRELGFPVFATEPRRLGDIPGLIERFGRLAGTETAAAEAAGRFRGERARLQRRYSSHPRVTVFYQILDASLLTVNGQHLINDVIDLCGGRNVFSGLPALTPRVDIESVLQRNPDAVLASGHEPLWPAWEQRWRGWLALNAAARGNLFFIDPDLIHRQSPRILQGAGQVCAALEKARATPDAVKLR